MRGLGLYDFPRFDAVFSFSLRLASPSPPPLPPFPSNYRVTNFARCKPRISPIGAPCQFKAILSASRSYLETFVSREMTSFRITSPLHASRSPSIFHRLIVLVDSFRLIAIEGRNRLLPFPLHCIRIHSIDEDKQDFRTGANRIARRYMCMYG